MDKVMQTGVWTTYPQLSVAKHSHRLICYNDTQILSLNGETEDAVVSDDFTFYNLNTKKEASTVSHPPARRHLTCVRVDSIIYVFGGDQYIGGTYSKDFWCYDIVGTTWKALPTPPSPTRPRRYQSMTHCNNFIYIFGGEYEWDKQLGDFLRFDMNSKKWEIMAPKGLVPSPRRYSSLDSYNGCVYLFAGRDVNVRMNDLWEYQPLKNVWWEIKYMGSCIPLPRSAHSSQIWKQSLIIHGGNDGTDTYCSSIFEFNFNTRQWSVIKTIGSIPGRYWHGTCITSTGVLIVNGGVSREEEFCGGWHLIQLPITLISSDIGFRIMDRFSHFQDVVFVRPE
jgi:N-acetylneuraminic acid mutarotase